MFLLLFLLLFTSTRFFKWFLKVILNDFIIIIINHY